MIFTESELKVKFPVRRFGDESDKPSDDTFGGALSAIQKKMQKPNEMQLIFQ